MGPFGVPELAIILVIVVIIFGVGKLPEIGGAFGKSVKEFKTQADDTDGHIAPIDIATGEPAASLAAGPGARSPRDAGTQAERREVRAEDI
jgi:sec-independent protein translocase protein TatA